MIWRIVNFIAALIPGAPRYWANERRRSREELDRILRYEWEKR